MDTKYIIIIVIVVGIIGIASIIALIIKNKNDKKAKEPIHKEYDPSIASVINEETPVATGTFVSNNMNPTPMQSSINNQSTMDAPNLESNTQINNISIPQNQSQIMSSIATENNTMMSSLEASNITNVATPIPIVQEQIIQPTPMFVNVGTVAEPIIDEPKPEVVAPTFIPAPEPVMSVIIEEPKPAVAESIIAPTMDNFEIKTPEPEVQTPNIKNVVPEPVQKTPMFVLEDVSEKNNNNSNPEPMKQTETASIYNQNVKVDIPEMEEIR